MPGLPASFTAAPVMLMLGLGSNVGDRLHHLQAAVDALKPLMPALRSSCIYESAALLPEHAPVGWDQPFLNMAVCGETSFGALTWLSEIKRIEQALGRQQRGHWGPREIDIDILAYGDECLGEAELTVPHAGLLMRDFALVPFAELAPNWQYPVPGDHFGARAAQLVRKLHSTLVKTRWSVAI